MVLTAERHKSLNPLEGMPYIAASYLQRMMGDDGWWPVKYFCCWQKMLVSKMQTSGENKAILTRRATNFVQEKERNPRIVNNFLVRGKFMHHLRGSDASPNSAWLTARLWRKPRQSFCGSVIINTRQNRRNRKAWESPTHTPLQKVLSGE